MQTKLKLMCLFTCMVMGIYFPTAHAFIVEDIAAEINTLHTFQQLQAEYARLGLMHDQLVNQFKAITGSYGLGSLGFNSNLQSWGSGTESWQNILHLYQKGSNPGLLNDVVKLLSKEFPIQESKVANPNPESINAKYYLLQAKTALATRATSQTDYDNIQKQIHYMHQLHAQIDHTQNLKAAVDLQNRLQVEGNLLQLEILRMLSLSSQQQAIAAQGHVNTIVDTYNAAR